MTTVTLRSRLLCFTVICFSLWSCASQKPPFIIFLTAQPNFVGHVHVLLCQSDLDSAAILDEHGAGRTGACPMPDDNIEITVTRGKELVGIPHEAITIARTGDRLPIALDADLK